MTVNDVWTCDVFGFVAFLMSAYDAIPFPFLFPFGVVERRRQYVDAPQEPGAPPDHQIDCLSWEK